ncbi:hypothetical protein BJ742DRAFT_817389 [Cladochytrium replicatum]|nr:hypothetical protein BJ742DRAFT_817389 [Cladochytrium replicatum]
MDAGPFPSRTHFTPYRSMMDYSYFFQSRNIPTPDDARSNHSSIGTSSESPHPYTSSESSFSGSLRYKYTSSTSCTKLSTLLASRRVQLAAEIAEWEQKKMNMEAERRARDAAFREKVRREEEEVEKVQEMVRTIIEDRKRAEVRDRRHTEQEKEVKRIREATARRDRWFMASVLDGTETPSAHTLGSGGDEGSIDGRRRSIGYFDGSSSVSVGSGASDLCSSRFSSYQDFSASRRMTESEVAHTELYAFILEVDQKRQLRRLESDERRRSAIERMRELLDCEDSFEVYARSILISDRSNDELASASKELDSRGSRILGLVHEDRSKMFRRCSVISLPADKYFSDDAPEPRSVSDVHWQLQQDSSSESKTTEAPHRMLGSRAGLDDSKLVELPHDGPMRISELSDPQPPLKYLGSPLKRFTSKSHSTDEMGFTTVDDWRCESMKKGWQRARHDGYGGIYGHSGFDQPEDNDISANVETATARAEN